jgi:hypothetical protein
LLQTLDWTKTNPKAVHRWRAKNNVNGLVYGNGGLVGWDKETCLQMKTHENADNEKAQIDFCWTVPHENLHNCYSTTIINADPQQAFIAGYREGTKMSLEQGLPVTPYNFKKLIYPQNLRVLITWMSIGADIEYGRFAMLGARMGCYATIIKGANILEIRDIEKIGNLFVKNIDMLETDLKAYGESVRQRLDLPVADFDADESKFFKFCMPKPINRGVQDRETK